MKKKKMVKKIRAAEDAYLKQHYMYLQLAAEADLSEDRDLYEELAKVMNMKRIVVLTLMSAIEIERGEEKWVD